MDEVDRWLQRAHAGELGAALAYRGHARSVRCPHERRRIHAILREELEHREEAAALLAARGARSDAKLDRRIARVGRLAGIACAITGHWAPMIGAAFAEAVNVGEYRHLRAAARAAGDDAVADFARRAQRLEAEHAAWFATCAERHGGLLAALARLMRPRPEPEVVPFTAPAAIGATPVPIAG